MSPFKFPPYRFRPKRFLLALLMLTAGSVWASPDWVEYAQTESSSFHYDPVNVRKPGGFPKKPPNLMRIWSVENLKSPTAGGVNSERSQFEFDCVVGTVRRVSMAAFSAPLATGKELSRQSSASSWFTITPQTPLAQLRQLACAAIN